MHAFWLYSVSFNIVDYNCRTMHDAVLEGYLTLVNIQVTPSSLQGQEKYSVVASFCSIDWIAQQRNPSTVPMFKDLQKQSILCDSTLLRVDLWDMVQRARAFDASLFNQTNPLADVVKSVPPTGVVFHETRCGSTLTANALASFQPLQTRVYSESPPPIAALKAASCTAYSDCQKLHLQLIRDVFYMMGRRAVPVQTKEQSLSQSLQNLPLYTFYKFQSISVHSIHAFAQAFPNVPWVFLYRDSVEVMQSHWELPPGKQPWFTGGAGGPVCTRNFGQSKQPAITQKVVSEQEKSMGELTKHEYCAAHLVSLYDTHTPRHESNEIRAVVS
jgi:hypothetical protein